MKPVWKKSNTWRRTQRTFVWWTNFSRSTPCGKILWVSTNLLLINTELKNMFVTNFLIGKFKRWNMRRFSTVPGRYSNIYCFINWGWISLIDPWTLECPSPWSNSRNPSSGCGFMAKTWKLRIIPWCLYRKRLRLLVNFIQAISSWELIHSPRKSWMCTIFISLGSFGFI